jgi:hypothetical protein
MIACACHPNYAQSTKSRIMVQAGRTVAQVVEHLLSECEALSANPTIKNSPKILKKYQRNYNN